MYTSWPVTLYIDTREVNVFCYFWVSYFSLRSHHQSQCYDGSSILIRGGSEAFRQKRYLITPKAEPSSDGEICDAHSLCAQPWKWWDEHTHKYLCILYDVSRTRLSRKSVAFPFLLSFICMQFQTKHWLIYNFNVLMFCRTRFSWV